MLLNIYQAFQTLSINVFQLLFPFHHMERKVRITDGQISCKVQWFYKSSAIHI